MGLWRYTTWQGILLLFPFLLFCSTLLFHLLFYPLFISQLLSGLLWQHCVSRRPDPQQPCWTVASQWGEDSGDEPPADRPSWGTLCLLKYPRWPRGEPSPMEGPQLPGEKYINNGKYKISCILWSLLCVVTICWERRNRSSKRDVSIIVWHSISLARSPVQLL